LLDHLREGVEAGMILAEPARDLGGEPPLRA